MPGYAQLSAHSASVIAPLLKLQGAQAGNRLCGASTPPLLIGTTWSRCSAGAPQ